MFKVLFLGLLGFLMYRIVTPSKKVDGPSKEQNDMPEFTDYEEIDE